MAETLDRKDIQGLVFTAFGRLPYAAYLMLRIVDAPAARATLARLTVSPGLKATYEVATQVAFTSQGLGALGLDAEARLTFPRAFYEGMVTEHRSRILGDEGVNAPSAWAWGGPAGEPVHVLVMVFAGSAARVEAEVAPLLHDPTAPSGMTLVTSLRGQRPPDGREHFGFADGLSQPIMQGTKEERKLSDADKRLHLIPPGEILLGHLDTYALRSRGASVLSDQDPTGLLPRAAEDAQRKDLGLNGSFLVFRQLAQDVPAFMAFIEEACNRAQFAGHPIGRELMAAKLVGRWRNGAPLAAAPVRDDQCAADKNDFDYRGKLSDDEGGLKCPLGAHIRRSNPRDALGDDPNASVRSVNRHRILRRGRSYGAKLDLAGPKALVGAERGLHFICLNSDLERQFEFVQHSWLNNPVFAGLHGETDPLVGPQSSAGSFTEPFDPVRRRHVGLSSFVTVKGGAYFFLPGILALQFLLSPKGS